MAIDDYERIRTDASYNKLSSMRLRRKFISAVSILSTGLGFTLIIFKLILGQPTNSGGKEDGMVSKKEINIKLDSLKHADSLLMTSIQNYRVVKNEIDTATHSDKIILIRLNSMDARIKADSVKILDLRASINPEKPEEILKLARLNDKVEQLKLENNNLRETLKSDQAQFQQSVNNQLTNSRTFYLALITILLPITIKFIMQQFKDYNKE